MKRRPYKNITCDPMTPGNVLDRTAAGILDALTRQTAVRVTTADVDTAIVAAGGKLHWKPIAVKALRNQGYAIISQKARQNSWYLLAGTPAEYEMHRRAVVQEVYSRQVSICRELAGAVAAQPSDPMLAATLRSAQMCALPLGTDPALGMTMQEVMTDLVPIV